MRLSHLYGSPWLYLRQWHNMVLGAEWSRRFPQILAANFSLTGETPITIDKLHDALLAIANMKVDENTNHVQLSALCIAIAKAALREAEAMYPYAEGSSP